jgi:phosphoserine phosphatase RsbU/P
MRFQEISSDVVSMIGPRTCRVAFIALLLSFVLSASANGGSPVELTQWRSGLSELDEGWVEHDGDNMGWSRPDFDDNAWQAANLDNLGPSQPGWRWFRRRVKLGPDHRDVRLLLNGGDGTYELYVNGIRAPGPRLRSSLAVTRPAERVIPIGDDAEVYEIALRTYVPASYAAWHFPQFATVTIGMPTAIEYERQALESQRLYGVSLSLAINLLLCLAGMGALALYASQRSQRDYLFLGLYLFLVGTSNLLASLQSSGMMPLSANFLLADPLIYICIIAQVEFTFRFARQRVSRAWRLYEVLLLAPLLLATLTWVGLFPSDDYVLIEAALTAPAGLLLSIALFIWYRHGNREAGWLILPSLAPAVTNALLDLGTASITLNWPRLIFLVNPIQIGPIPLQAVDLGALVFLLSIAIVMFFRFTRVSREQAVSAAEFHAAREIQRRLVPDSLPPLNGCKIEAAYLPAQEVGGDFYQVLPQVDGSTLVVIGDVSGKGLKAAMNGTLAIGALRALAGETSDPAQLLGRLNSEIVRAQDGGFITCICARITANGELHLANAGHLPPYRNGKEIGTEASLPLGLVPDLIYSKSRVEMRSGDTLTLLSDGVVEARSHGGELFGFERTQAISCRPAGEIAAAAQQFGQEDDITVLTLTFHPDVIPPSHQPMPSA